MARRSGHAKKIDVVHWTLAAEKTTGLAAAGTVAFTAFAAQHLPETHLRMRGEWYATIDGVLAPGTSTAVYAGYILVPEGTAGTVLWSPGSDGDAPWIWWDVFHLSYEEQVVDTIAAAGVSARRIIDSKAMRHNRNQEGQLVFENQSLQGTPAVNAFASFRVLSGS